MWKPPISMCGAKGYGFLAVLLWNRESISTILVWKRVWFVHSGLELGIFLEEATSSSFVDKTISLLMSVRQPCTCRNSLSRAPVTRPGPGLQVWNRISNFWSGVKSQILVWNWVRVSGRVLQTPTQFFWMYPAWVFRRQFYTQMGGSLCLAFLAETVETGTKNRCLIEATIHKWILTSCGLSLR